MKNAKGCGPKCCICLSRVLLIAKRCDPLDAIKLRSLAAMPHPASLNRQGCREKASAWSKILSPHVNLPWGKFVAFWLISPNLCHPEINSGQVSVRIYFMYAQWISLKQKSPIRQYELYILECTSPSPQGIFIKAISKRKRRDIRIS